MPETPATDKPARAVRAPDEARDAVFRAVALIEAALAAQRAGTLDQLVRQRPRAARWLMRRFEPLMVGALGDALEVEQPLALMADLLLRWALTQLRPDREPSFDGIQHKAWLDLTAWRPMLAATCYAGVLVVPEFRERYRRRIDEPAIENLCGLWGVGPSTFYRHLDRAKRTMAELLVREPIGLPMRFALRRWMQAEVARRQGLDKAERRAAWHGRQAERALQRHDIGSALWHHLAAGDVRGFIHALQLDALQSANHPETDALVERLAAGALTARDRVEIELARAALARTRNMPERAQQACEQALQIAAAARDKLLIGIAYGALGAFHEARDADRAFACYEDSAECLQQADPALSDRAAIEAYLTTLTRLAWLYLQRNDPRAKTVLERAHEIGASINVPDEIAGMLAQSRGELARRSGQLREALQHKQRALNIFERLGDRRSVLATWLNLSSIYAELQQFERAVDYSQRILDVAARQDVEPQIVAGTHVNLGATYYLDGRLDAAIEQYRLALDASVRSGLRLEATRAHFNLAEAYYKRFQTSHDVRDEQSGDAHVEAVLNAPMSESGPAAHELARKLKQEVLGNADPAANDRLIAEESAIHLDEMAEIQRQRAVLAVPISPEAHVRARLAIARAYLDISMKEREAALELIARHGLGTSFTQELGALRAAFDRELTREQRLLGHWHDGAADLLPEATRVALIEWLLGRDSINKSTYADLCGVSPATASKHLALLAERGLLRQTGKGPSTRYLLPN
jgi:tetratricopeptide (TPR) repeat protein/DNA-binding transcriptional ArsR family regulator